MTTPGEVDLRFRDAQQVACQTEELAVRSMAPFHCPIPLDAQAVVRVECKAPHDVVDVDRVRCVPPARKSAPSDFKWLDKLLPPEIILRLVFVQK